MREMLLCMGLMLVVCVTTVAQDVRDFGMMPAIHEETRETTGVDSFRLRLEGDPTNTLEDSVARVEAFYGNKVPLGEMEIRWPDPETTTATFVEAESGEEYSLIFYDDGSPNIWLELEDKTTGDKLTIKHLGPPADRKIYRSREEAFAAAEKARQQSQWIIEGESREQYKKIVATVGMVVFEVDTVLGIAPGQKPPIEILIK